jgi:flavin-dependent dehydrogenase
MNNYDVIIAGASFGGLAAAKALIGKRVLLVDPKPIGHGQTSACGTLYGVIEALGLYDSLRQVHSTIILHTPHHDLTFRMAYPFCTFDYADFCALLTDRGRADFLQANVLGLDGNTVVTSRGDYRARCVIDASGWRAVLGPDRSRAYQSQGGMSFGIETTVPYQDEGLHFWYEPNRLMPFGVTWLFPVGTVSRFGLASYLGQTKLKAGLIDWLDKDFNLPPASFHGGYLPYTLQAPTAGLVFRVGDAAGHCLPLTGEGIRPALYFGLATGRLVRRVLDNELSLEQALAQYDDFVMKHQLYYDTLLKLQNWLPRLPIRLMEDAVKLIHWPRMLAPVMERYWRAFNPTALKPTTEELRIIQRHLPDKRRQTQLTA